jgi:amidase
MPTRDLHYCELVEIGQRIQKREQSSVEATQAQLDRIAHLDGQLKSYAYVMASAALEQAHAAEKEIAAGEVRGPLHGVPIAVKDLCWTKDAPTAAGMTIYRDYRPSEDATVVSRLKEAGAVILGKLQLTEGAYADHHPEIDPPRNPWDATLWSGASSSGSGVATAAGLCYGSLGSDTGGSIRFPSAANRSAATAFLNSPRRWTISGPWPEVRWIAARYWAPSPARIRTIRPPCWSRCRIIWRI